MGGNLKEDEIVDIKNRGSPYSEIKNFVETGTYKADSTIIASKHFENVYTIEIFEPLHIESSKRCEDLGITNIKFVLGDTLQKMPEVMDSVGGNGCVYFIDAHISGGDSSWNQKIRVPLFEELDIILGYTIPPSVFIFDDLRLWKSIKAWDWAHITNDAIVDKFREKGIELLSYYEKDDRFYVYTK